MRTDTSDTPDTPDTLGASEPSQAEASQAEALARDTPRREKREKRYTGSSVYRRQRRSWRWYAWRLVAVTLAVVAIVVGTRALSARIGADDALTVRIEDQQPVTVDLRTAFPRSPYVFGVNVFPVEGSQALDGAYGFMPYDAKTVTGITSAGFTMLRFPGGNWGEDHTASFEQVAAYLRLAQQTHTTPLMQVRLKNGSPAQAAALVRFCNIPSDPNRLNTPNVPDVPVRYWVIGNEPDLIGPSYTVADYVRDFIAFATAMKAADPTIQIFGPEISQYDSLTLPADATGAPWLTGFLSGIATYQQAHHVHLLDAVSFHRYPFNQAISSTGLLFASASEWRYSLPPLRQEIQRIMGTALPLAITEVNTSPLGGTTTSPMATALWWADTLGTLLEEQTEYVDFFALRGIDQPYGMLTGAGDETPLLHVVQMYQHMQPEVIPVGGTSGPVSLYAATNADRSIATLFFVNSTAADAAVSITPSGPFSAWHAASVTVPPYGVVCVELHRNSAGRYFLFAPTAQILASGQSGIIRTFPLPQ
ncbi:MAG: hypothetical protein OJF49_002550 [Ktedonobacterales bacterium]|jgi:hypothetical protein|nr:MAG: hypothetical protein OJF49_002550 [Ktedonobacterales bacterium]